MIRLYLMNTNVRIGNYILNHNFFSWLIIVITCSDNFWFYTRISCTVLMIQTSVNIFKKNSLYQSIKIEPTRNYQSTFTTVSQCHYLILNLEIQSNCYITCYLYSHQITLLLKPKISSYFC